MKKTFSLGTVLSMTTGTLLCSVEDLYAIASHLVGRDVFTHELPSCFRQCREPLLAQHPQLRAVTAEEVTRDNWQQWLNGWIEQYGDSFEVAALESSDITNKHPLQTLAEVMRPDQNVVVVLDDGAAS